MGPNGELIICDTGNDRVLLVDPDSGNKLGVIGAHNGVTQLNFPTSVALDGLNVVVADSGNNRVERGCNSHGSWITCGVLQVKTFTLAGQLLQEIGSFGKNPGQFRSAEVVAVDQLGFILVGDAGNARVSRLCWENFGEPPGLFAGAGVQARWHFGEDLRQQKRFRLGLRPAGHSQLGHHRRR